MLQLRQYIALQIILLLLVSFSKGSRTSQRRRRNKQQCDDVTPMELQSDIQEGTTLYNMRSYVYVGTPDTYTVVGYKFNNKSYDVGNSEGFDCTAQDFTDVRRYICIRSDGRLEIRVGSDFQQIAGGSKIEIIIKPYSSENQGLGLCKFIFLIKFHPTLTPPPTTARPSTTTTTTKKTTTTTAAKTTTKLSSTLLKSSSPENHGLTTLTSEEEEEYTRSPDDDIATLPTVDPCLEEKILQKRLKRCRPKSIELPTIVTNNSSQSLFEYKIDLPASTPILKTAFVKVGSYSTSLKLSSSFTIKVYHGSGDSKSLFKSIPAKLKKEQIIVSVDKFIPTHTSRITVEIYKNKKRVSLPGSRVSLGIDSYVFCLNDTCSRHYQSLQHHVGKIQCGSILKKITVAQFDTCFAVCPTEETTSRNGSYLWPLTFPNRTVTLACQGGVGNVSRVCHKVGNQLPKWGQVNVENCKSTEDKRSKALENLENVVIDASNASEASEQLKNITQSDPETMPASQLNSVTKILEELSTFAANEKVANDMLDTVDNCMEASHASIMEGQRTNNVSKRMVTILSKVCEAMLTNKTEFTMSKKGFALAGTRVSKSSFQGVAISYNPSSRINSTSQISIQRGPSKAPEDSSASIHLPKALLLSRGNERNDLVAIAYDQDKLFQEAGRSRLNSKIISAEVRNVKISGLKTPVVTKFKTKNDSNDVEEICSWWDFNLYGGTGGWSSTGCSVSKAKSGGFTECHCDHLTNFAVLLGAKIPKKETTHQLVLKFISYIGIGISLAGTFFTLISYILFPKLRDNAPPKILMNLCAALIFLQAIFLIGIERTNPRQGCQAVAFLLQYVLLCVLSWSGVEGFFSYRGIVLPMKSEVQSLMLKATMFGWVVPILFPILGIAIWPGEYGDERSCAVKGLPLYITVIAPVALVMFLNLFSIISIMAALNKSSKMYPHNAINALHRLRIIAAFVLLFGLTWVFGFLVIANDIVAFQYIFCILNSLQGFFLFIFYGIRNENVRKSWLDKFQTYRERRAFSTSAATKRTDSSFDSATYNKSDSLRSNSLKKSKDVDIEDVQFQVHPKARANLYETPLTV